MLLKRTSQARYKYMAIFGELVPSWLYSQFQLIDPMSGVNNNINIKDNNNNKYNVNNDNNNNNKNNITTTTTTKENNLKTIGL